ncbi:MAG: DUF3800 domain-containing protein [Methanomassiliicoccaceae archaeon]|nr:DUF3800 domain-containing protein [Methanomassiliicoccaceae archaeon]
MFIDETKNNENTKFAMTATVTDRPQEFIRIAKELRREWEQLSFEKYGVTPEELKDKIPKYSGSPEHVKIRVLKEIADAEARTYGVYVDKTADDSWCGISNSRIQKKELKELISIAFTDTKSKNILVIIDQSSDYGGRVADFVEKHAKRYGKDVKAKEESSKTGDHKEGLQVADFVTGALGEFVKAGNADKIDIIGMTDERTKPNDRTMNRLRRLNRRRE